MESNDEPDHTQLVSVHVFSRPLRQLEDAAKLHGISRVDAFNQAIDLWTFIAGRGWIGKPFTIVMKETASPRALTGWRRLLARFVSVTIVQRSSVQITLPGDSTEVIVEEALRRLRDQDQE